MNKSLRPVRAPQTSASRGNDWALVLRMPSHSERTRRHIEPSDPSAGSKGAVLFVQIARAITEAVQEGRLAAGARLPGSRTLARVLGVHRNTVLRAYAELLAEGWLESHEGRGTFVSSDLPAVDRPAPRGAKRALSSGAASKQRGGVPFELAPWHGIEASYVPARDGVLQMFGGLGDLRLLPSDALARAVRRTLRRGSGQLGYTDPRGARRLRAAVAQLLRSMRGIAVEEDGVLITRGSQMALYLAARSLVQPGDVVAVEQWGYPPAWQALRLAGARLLPVPVDGHGVRVAELRRLCRRHAVRALYFTPHHQYPTTVSLAPSRRLELLELAAEFRMALLEDDYDHEFHYEGQPLLPLASADTRGHTVYLGTLSKVLAPGLRIGYLVAHPELLERAMRYRYFLDRQGDAVTEVAIAELMEDGELQRHFRRARKLYHERRDHCVQLLQANFPGQLTFRTPPGGMALWVRVRDVDVTSWLRHSARRGVEFQPGSLFAFERGGENQARFGYACLDREELTEAVRRLRAAWHECKRAP